MAQMISHSIAFTPLNTITATSVTVGAPPVYAVGNLLILSVMLGGTGGATVTTPSGWTRLSTSSSPLAVFSRTATSSETATTVSFSAGAPASAYIAAYPAATVNSSSFSASASNVVTYAPTFPTGVTSGQVVAMIAGATAQPITASGSTAFHSWSGYSNLKLPSNWTHEIESFGPSNMDASSNPATPAVALGDLAGSTTAATTLSSTNGSNFYVGFLVLTITGTPPTPFTVTALAEGNAAAGMALTVTSLIQADTNQTGATANSYSHGGSAVPQIALIPTATGSKVFGALTEWQPGSAYTPLSTTSFDQNFVVSNNGAHGTFSTSNPTTAGTSVTVGASAPSNTRVNIAAAEIVANGALTQRVVAISAGKTFTDFTSTSVTRSAYFLGTQPSAGDLLVATVSVYSTYKQGIAPSITISDTAGHTWTPLVESTDVSGAYAGVWIAPVSVTPPVTPPPSAGLIERAVFTDSNWNVTWTTPGSPAVSFGAPIASFIATQDTPGAPVQFDASGSFETGAAITSYTWDFGDGSTPRTTTSPQISRSYVKIGNYAVILAVTDAAGNQAQTEQLVPVIVDKVPIPAFTADVLLYNVSVDASDSTDSDGAIVSYDWDWGDGAIGSGLTTNHTYEFGGEYEITLILTDNQGLVNTVSKTVVAAPLPDAEFLITVNALVVTVNAQESSDFNPITQYTWFWGETGTANSHGITAKHTYRTAGTYPIALQITDAAGNTDVVTHEVSVSPIFVPEPPRASFTFVTTNLKASFNAKASSSSDSTITNYAWDFGDGHAGSGVNPSHTYSDGGTYSVELTVTDFLGLAGRQSRSVTVSPAFHPQILEGFDASYNKPTGAQAAAAGRKACVLYITDPGPGNKGVTQSVFNDYNSHGIAIAFIWEAGASAVLNGRSQGVSDAQNAQANLSALDGPSDRRPLYFAIDFDIQPSDYGKAKAYFQGVNSVIGENRTGAYGHYDILSYLTQQKVISKRWQTYAWSGGLVYSPLDIYQYSNDHALGSGTVDYDRMYSDNWGQKAVDSPSTTPKETLTWPYQDMNHRQVISDDDYDPDISWQHHRDRGSLGGVDHNCPYGTPLYANCAGRAYTIPLSQGGTGGRTLNLHLGNSGWYDQYMHLSSFAVSNGQLVKQGQLVGHSGASGNGSDYYYAPHFHLHRYTPGGTRVNAWHYFNGGGTGDSRNIPPGQIIVTLQTGVPNQMFWRKLQWFAKSHGYAYPCDGYMSIPAWKGVQRGMVSHGYHGSIDGVPGTSLRKALQSVAHQHGSNSAIDGTLSTDDYRALSRWLNG